MVIAKPDITYSQLPSSSGGFLNLFDVCLDLRDLAGENFLLSAMMRSFLLPIRHSNLLPQTVQLPGVSPKLTFAPLRVISALAATVVPCLKYAVRDRNSSGLRPISRATSATALIIPMEKSAWVVPDLPITNSPLG